MKGQLFEEFNKAMMALRWTKSNLMKLAYRGDISGIDSAIPQNWVDDHPEYPDTFYLATDCTNLCCRVVDLRDLIPDCRAEKIIEMNEILQRWTRLIGDASQVEKRNELDMSFHELDQEVLMYMEKGGEKP